MEKSAHVLTEDLGVVPGTSSEMGNGREQLRDCEVAVSEYALERFGEKPDSSG
jgi:hypothetical protein